MHSTTLSVIVHILLMLTALSTEAVKIGMSKPLPITTTIPSSTTIEQNTEETNTEVFSIDASVTDATTKTSTAQSISPSEWPEFPPKKTSRASTTEKIATTITERSTIVTPSTTKNSHDLPNITENAETPSTSFRKRPNKHEYCFCDLTRDSCDLNCCCDPDCTTQALKVFSCILEVHNNLETHKGGFEGQRYQQGLPSCEVSDGWLCVFRTYKPVMKNQASEYLKDTSQHYTWPNLLLESEDIKNRDFYKLGDLLRLINVETREIQNFDLPSPFQSSSCDIQQPIYYLQPSKRSCPISSYEDLKQAELRMLQLVENYKIFQAPTIPDDVYDSGNLKSFGGNITMYKCYENKQNCTPYKDAKSDGKNFELLKVKVNILHNYSNIQEVVVDLWFQNFEVYQNFKSTEEQDYWLYYETEFFNKTLKEYKLTSYAATRKLPLTSGPLGYLTGKPVIIARHEPFNKTQAFSMKNRIINYFAYNNTESHTLALLAKENGVCKRSKSEKEFISYGINVAKFCKITIENDTLLKKEPLITNFTEICFNLQQRIYDEIFGQDLDIDDLSTYIVSQLGRPQHVANKWIQLQAYNTHFDSVVGQYLHETNTFVCRNILLSLRYEFHMANVIIDDVPLQNVINYAVLHFADRHDLEFSLNENLEVPITMTVRFFDMHEKAASAGFTFKIFNLLYCSMLYLVISLY